MHLITYDVKLAMLLCIGRQILSRKYRTLRRKFSRRTEKKICDGTRRNKVITIKIYKYKVHIFHTKNVRQTFLVCTRSSFVSDTHHTRSTVGKRHITALSTGRLFSLIISLISHENLFNFYVHCYY